MPTGIQLSSGVVVGQPIPLDAKFGPYNSTADALNDIGVGLRYRGLTVGVYENGVLKEYWFKDGTGNEHFVAKSSDVTWDSVLNKPTTFTPSAHNHPASQISDSTTAGRALLTAANAAAQRTLLNVADGAEVNVNADWNATTGDAQILNKPSTFPPSVHNHLIEEVTGLQTILDTKQEVVARRIFVTSNSSIYYVVQGRNVELSFSAFGGTTEVRLPRMVNANSAHDDAKDKDMFVLRLNSLTGSATVSVTASQWTGSSYTNTIRYLFTPTSTGTWTFVMRSGVWVAAGVETHTHTASAITDSTAAGRALLTAATVQAQRTALDIFVNEANLAAIQALQGNFQRVYVASDTGKIYVWSGSGSTYIEVSPNIKSDWNATSGDAQILNRPSTVPYQIIAACSDETSLLTTGQKLVFRNNFLWLPASFQVSVTEAPTGSSLVVQLREGTQVILTATVATGQFHASAPVGPFGIDEFDGGKVLNIFVQQVGTFAGKGLKVYLEGTRPL